MLRLFDCAVLAARAQMILGLMVVLVAAVATSVGNGPVGLERALGDPALLKWILLAAAAVCAMSFRRSLARTAARVARETDQITPGRGKRLQMRLVLNLRLATGALAVLTLTAAPDLLIRPAALLVDPALAQTVWAATMSVGLAYFGAAARAARFGLRRPAPGLSGA
jgi:hypothetical protein